MAALIYEDLSFQIIGISYQIDDDLGFGFDEKTYGNAFELLLKKKKIDYQREAYVPIRIDGQIVAKRYIDFVISGKIVVELKAGNYNYRQACIQTFQYLKSSRLQVGIIIRFTKDGVKIKRIFNHLEN
ncbi:MAG: GxxExxY protein [Patescibacteria group bacterium]